MRRLCLFVFALLIALSSGAPVAAKETIRFAVGPYQPTPADTKKAFEPFFAWLAEQLGVSYEFHAVGDWAGLAVALGNGQADVAWMGPWGYVLAHHDSGAEAIATVLYDGKPTYHSIIVGRSGEPIRNWPDDAKGRSIAFAGVGSTSGWLMPTYWYRQMGIDPKQFFVYREGGSHAANEIAVVSGQVDFTTDYDRNRTAMIESGAIAVDATRIYWTSPPLPNDALAVRAGLDPALVARIRKAVVAIDSETAARIMPAHYTGWVAADHSSYKMIEDAGLALDKLRKKE